MKEKLKWNHRTNPLLNLSLIFLLVNYPICYVINTVWREFDIAQVWIMCKSGYARTREICNLIINHYKHMSTPISKNLIVFGDGVIVCKWCWYEHTEQNETQHKYNWNIWHDILAQKNIRAYIYIFFFAFNLFFLV